MFGLFKLIIVFIVGIMILGASFFTSIFTNSTVSKDNAMNTYNNFLQNVSSLGITSDRKIQGERTFGIDEYVGTYKANYNNTTKEETIFGGTALNRENGNTIKLKIKVEISKSTKQIFNPVYKTLRIELFIPLSLDNTSFITLFLQQIDLKFKNTK